ncbi:MAG: hypothetical protein Q9187_007286, partial [Circinaria calcarea]
MSPGDRAPAVPPKAARSFNYATDDGLQVAPHEYYDAKKQNPQLAIGSAEKYAAPDSDPATGLQVHYPAIPSSKVQPPRRRRLYIWMIVVVATIIAIAAAVSATVIITHKQRLNSSKSSSVNPPSTIATSAVTAPLTVTTNSTVSSTVNAPSSSSSTAAPTPTTSNAAIPSDSELSKSGAFRGTGMATMNPRNDADGIWLVYQDFTGDVRLVSYSLSGAWQSSESLGVKNVANASAMTATSYGPDGSVVVSATYFRKLIDRKVTVCQYRLFYIDLSGTLQDMVRTNENSWEPGNIGTYSFRAAATSSLAVFWDSTFGENLTGGGLRLYAGGPDGLIHEYGYDQMTDLWTPGYIFPGTNGYAGCSIGFTTTLTTLHLLNADNELEFWWRNWKKGNSSYPSGSWNK